MHLAQYPFSVFEEHGVHLLGGEAGLLGPPFRQAPDQVYPPLPGVPQGPYGPIAPEEDPIGPEPVEAPPQDGAEAAVVAVGLVLEGGEVGNQVWPVLGHLNQLSPGGDAQVGGDDGEVGKIGQDSVQLLWLAELGIQGMEHLARVYQDGEAQGWSLW